MKNEKDFICEFVNQSDTLNWRVPMGVRSDMSGPPMTILSGETFVFQNRHNQDIYSPYSRIVLTGELKQREKEIQESMGSRPVYRKVMETYEIPKVHLHKNKNWKLPEDTPGSMAIELLNEADFFVGASYRMIDHSYMMPFQIPVYIFLPANHGFAEHKRIIKQRPQYHEILGPGGGMISIRVPGSDVRYESRSKAELEKLEEIREKFSRMHVKNLKLMT